MDARDTIFRLVVKSLIAAALLVLLVLTLLRLLDLLILVFGAVVVATLLRGLADAIERHTPLNGNWSLAAAILLVVAVFAGVGWLFGSQLQTDLGAVARTLRQSWEGLRLGIAGFPGGKEVASAMQSARLPTDNFVPKLVGALNWVTTVAIDLVVVLFGIVFIAADPALYRRGLALMFPRPQRPLANEALVDAGLALRQWMIGLFAVMIFIGVFCGLGLWLVGVPSAAGLGLIAGLFELIPYLGPIISMLPVALVAAAKGPETLMLGLAVMLVVHWVEAAIVAPLAAKRMVSLPPAVSVFGVIAGGMLFGPVGLVFASPLLVVAMVLVKRLWVEEALHTPTHVPGRDPSRDDERRSIAYVLAMPRTPAGTPPHPKGAERFNEDRATYTVKGDSQPDIKAGVKAIRETVRTLKPKPGVYRMLDARGDVLYVGKARALKNRVANYCQVTNLSSRLQRMVSQTRSMEIVTTNSEAEALLLEAQLIKRFRPPYNVLLRDDKSFPFILLRADHAFPRIMKHRGARKAKGDYYGPLRQRRIGQHHD